jgi:transposase
MRYHLYEWLMMEYKLGGNYIRPIELRRNNWLFCGNHDAARNTAIMYSMLGCCKAHQVNFRDWLVFILNNIYKYGDDYSKDLA